jgi:hypothetical protein
MTESSSARPVPGPPRSGSGHPQAAGAVGGSGSSAPLGTDAGAGAEDPYADLDRRPVAEHVAVFEAEHSRLQRELGTIDQL